MGPRAVSKVLWIIAPTVLVIGAAISVTWRPTQPTVRTASMAEIRAVLPLELAEDSPPVDEKAVVRFKKLVALGNSLDSRQVLQTTESRPSASSKSAMVSTLR